MNSHAPHPVQTANQQAVCACVSKAALSRHSLRRRLATHSTNEAKQTALLVEDILSPLFPRIHIQAQNGRQPAFISCPGWLGRRLQDSTSLAGPVNGAVYATMLLLVQTTA